MIKPPTKEFVGSDFEAIQFVMRTNKRRNLSSAQWATIGVEAEEVMSAIAEEAKARQVRKPSDSVSQLIDSQTPKDNSKLADHKAAEIFQTNRTYINQAAKIQKASLEVFAKVKAGTMTMQVRRPPQPDRRSGEYLAGP